MRSLVLQFNSRCVLFAMVMSAALACHAQPHDRRPTAMREAPRVANLHAFACLYGVVRWFHPSDAAAEVDWDRFAIEGVDRVVAARDARALHTALTELFAPIAPTVHIVSTVEPFPDEPALHPASTSGLDIVAWQHKGYGDSTIPSGYASKRRHRNRSVAAPGVPFAALSQSVDATPYRGARVRLRGKLRTADHGQGRFWLRVYRGDASGFFDNMERHPVLSESWAQGEIVGTIDADATKIVFGVLKLGIGTAWHDDLELAVEARDGTWTPIEVSDAGFESPDPMKSWNAGIGSTSGPDSLDGWNLTVDRSRPAAGASSLRIDPAIKILTDELFDKAPAAGETVDIDLGSGLRARVPIALYSKDNHTIGDDPEIVRQLQAKPTPQRPDGFDVAAGTADVIVLWNVFEHFWPYWNVVSVDWSAALDDALADSLDDRSVDDHVATLERLTAAAPDGHVRTGCPGASERGSLPLALDLIERQIVVTASAVPAVERGDVIVSIDGSTATQLLATEVAFVSGSSQWRTLKGLERIGSGPVGASVHLRLQRGNAPLSVAVARSTHQATETSSHQAIERFRDGVYYVDLRRASMADIRAILDRLSVAPGVVFDVRGRPAVNHEVLAHLLTRRDDIKAWEAIPLVIRPDSAAAPSSWEDTTAWNMPPALLQVAQPHISGRVAFLTGPATISYAEDVMAFVEHYQLGEIVGAGTAGSDGDMAMITAPSGCDTFFTGRRVTKPNGSPLHLLGVQPTIPTSRTIAGVAAGRDEVLEKALEYVRGGAK